MSNHRNGVVQSILDETPDDMDLRILICELGQQDSRIVTCPDSRIASTLVRDDIMRGIAAPMDLSETLGYGVDRQLWPHECDQRYQEGKTQGRLLAKLARKLRDRAREVLAMRESGEPLYRLYEELDSFYPMVDIDVAVDAVNRWSPGSEKLLARKLLLATLKLIETGYGRTTPGFTTEEVSSE